MLRLNVDEHPGGLLAPNIKVVEVSPTRQLWVHMHQCDSHVQGFWGRGGAGQCADSNSWLCVQSTHCKLV